MTLNELVKNPATKFVDVRSEMEFNMGHLKGAINIPLDQLQRRYHEITKFGNAPIVFYCRSGNRSGQAIGFLHQVGFRNIYNGGALEELEFHVH